MSRFVGVTKVIRFNWPTFTACAAIAVISFALGTVWSRVVGAGAILGLANALLVTHWVYDRSELYTLQWLTRYAPHPLRVLRVHTGLDEIATLLAALYPQAEHRVCDIYDRRYATEPSIARARRDVAEQTAMADHLPIDTGWSDLVIGFLALHEVRDPAVRDQLFAELRRVSRYGGHVVIVEHLRDLANLLAYGPGALHFLPRSAWIRAEAAGLRLIDEQAITPFVRVFAFEAT